MKKEKLIYILMGFGLIFFLLIFNTLTLNICEVFIVNVHPNNLDYLIINDDYILFIYLIVLEWVIILLIFFLLRNHLHKLKFYWLISLCLTLGSTFLAITDSSFDYKYSLNYKERQGKEKLISIGLARGIYNVVDHCKSYDEVVSLLGKPHYIDSTNIKIRTDISIKENNTLEDVPYIVIGYKTDKTNGNGENYYLFFSWECENSQFKYDFSLHPHSENYFLSPPLPVARL